MEPQSLKTIVKWSGGKLLHGDPDSRIAGISTDSRQVKPGEIFLALSGDRFDGHEFIEKALKLGASGVIASRSIENFSGRWPGDIVPALR